MEAASNGTTLLLGSYVGMLMGAALLVFGAACAGALRRGEERTTGGGSSHWQASLPRR